MQVRATKYLRKLELMQEQIQFSKSGPIWETDYDLNINF